MSARRRLLRAVAIGAATLLILAVTAVLLLQTPWAQRSIGRLAADRVGRALDADVSIGRVSGNLWSSVTLDDVAIRRAGVTVIDVDRVTARYDLPGLLRGELALRYVGLEHPVVRLARGPQGRLLLAGMLGGGPAATGPRRSFSIERIQVRRGVVAIGSEPAEVSGFRIPDRIERLELRLSLTTGPQGAKLRIEHASFAGIAPDVVVTSMSGNATIGPHDLTIDDVAVRTADSGLRFHGTVENYGSLGAS